MSGDHRTSEQEGVSRSSENEDSERGTKETISFDIFRTKGSIFDTVEFQPIRLDMNDCEDPGNPAK